MSRQIVLSRGAVEAGLWYALSPRYDREITREMQQAPPDMIDYWSHELETDPQMKEDLAIVLQEEVQVMRDQRKADRSLGAKKSHYIYPQFDQIWKRIVLVKKRIKERLETAIPTMVYKQLRMKKITSHGVHSS